MESLSFNFSFKHSFSLLLFFFFSFSYLYSSFKVTDLIFILFWSVVNDDSVDFVSQIIMTVSSYILVNFFFYPHQSDFMNLNFRKSVMGCKKKQPIINGSFWYKNIAAHKLQSNLAHIVHGAQLSPLNSTFTS